jgi:hypothetical protein
MRCIPSRAGRLRVQRLHQARDQPAQRLGHRERVARLVALAIAPGKPRAGGARRIPELLAHARGDALGAAEPARRLLDGQQAVRGELLRQIGLGRVDVDARARHDDLQRDRIDLDQRLLAQRQRELAQHAAQRSAGPQPGD